MDWKIKPLPPSRIPEALALCREVFLDFEAPEYPPEGTASFLSFLEEPQILRMVRRGLLEFWGAYCGKVLAGVGALRDKRHISLLFVRREKLHQGAGSALMQKMLACCTEAGVKRVTVHASPYGQPFYRAMGFHAAAPEQNQDGIRYFPMERTL